MRMILTIILIFLSSLLAYADNQTAPGSAATAETSEQVAKDLTEFRKQLVGMKKEWDKFDFDLWFRLKLAS